MFAPNCSWKVAKKQPNNLTPIHVCSPAAVVIKKIKRLNLKWKFCLPWLDRFKYFFSAQRLRHRIGWYRRWPSYFTTFFVSVFSAPLTLRDHLSSLIHRWSILAGHQTWPRDLSVATNISLYISQIQWRFCVGAGGTIVTMKILGYFVVSIDTICLHCSWWWIDGRFRGLLPEVQIVRVQTGEVGLRAVKLSQQGLVKYGIGNHLGGSRGGSSK